MNRETFLGERILPRAIWIIIGGTISIALIPFGPRESYGVLLDLIPLGIGAITWRVLFHFHVKRENEEEVDRFEDIERLNNCDIGIRASKRRITHRIVEEYAIEA